ncbi:MAG TPA: adenylosuccinate synthetase, partial [Anaerohalosphaeraceae bacterium]|nr:adenylosuccinate synthetase [Anaerohalosphaeraceae bacterium]
KLGGVSEIAMMHLDTLAGMREIKLCRAYKIGGKETTFFPASVEELAEAECIYQTLDGWNEDLSTIREYEALPQPVKDYIKAVESIVGVPVTMVGVGPKRSQAIFRNPV